MTSVRTERMTDRFLDIALTEGIKLVRDGLTNYTNVPHKVMHHSPDGYSWGYAGSGPSDLALNIAENMLLILGYTGPRTDYKLGSCFDRAWRIHQDLKWAFLVDAPNAGVTIPYDTMKAWIRQYMAEDQPTE